MQPKAPKTSGKTHRRSRTGCFTCRLRRKKCDEGKLMCKACKHLGLQCEYKRPVWWGSADQRKRQKEGIKALIKRTKLSEKVAQISPLSADSPPELSRSAPTSECTSEHSRLANMANLRGRRSQSVESGYSLEYEADGDHSLSHSHAQYQYPHHHAAAHHPMHYVPVHHVHHHSGYDVDVMTEKQTFVSNMPVVPGEPTFAALDLHSTMGSPDVGQLESFQFLDFGHSQATPSCVSTVSDMFSPQMYAYNPLPVDDSDRRFLEHFLDSVVRRIFPVLDVSMQGMARQEVILPALATNRCYMHCCLSIAAQHLKSARQTPAEYIDQDIMRHRYATIAELCEALKRDTDHLQILEAALGMILFQTAVGHPDDSLPDIPWHSHFQAATSLVHKLDLPRALDNITAPGGSPAQYAPAPFNMTLTAWIDILGATMIGRAPQFADTYREKHLSEGHSGLSELMGCDDQVMYLISEIACLEALKTDNMLTDMDLCEHVKSLASKIDQTEDIMYANNGGSTTLLPVIRPDGTINQLSLTQHITSAFRSAARIYLCSLVPGFDRNQHQVKELLDKLVGTLEQIPAGPDGFDRSLVWVYLIGGSVATEGSLFRYFLGKRGAQLGTEGIDGAWGRMRKLLGEVWKIEDNPATAMGGSRWRDVMNMNGWDYLLI